MKIDFITNHKNLSVGSYRIWVNDLSNSINRFTSESASILMLNEMRPESDIEIFAKGLTSQAASRKSGSPDKLIGIINPPGGMKHEADFIIVGSHEERDSLAMNDNVFIVPLIEAMFDFHKPPKIHEPKEQLTIGLHGSSTHLSKVKPFLFDALVELSSEMNFKISMISDRDKIIHGFPGHIQVESKKWCLETIMEDLLEFDIGLVVNAMKLPTIGAQPNKGLWLNDITMRFKNKSNAGRAFVLHQLGIPVVADLTPSHFHIMGSDSCGALAFSKEGWKRGIRRFADDKERYEVAQAAHYEMLMKYEPRMIVSRFMQDLNTIL